MTAMLWSLLGQFGGWLALILAGLGVLHWRERRARKEERDAIEARQAGEDRDALARRIESDRRADRPDVARGVRERHTRPE